MCRFTPHAGNTRTSNYGTKFAKLRHIAIFTRQTSGIYRNDKAVLHVLHLDPTDSQLNVTQTNLTWPGQSELQTFRITGIYQLLVEWEATPVSHVSTSKQRPFDAIKAYSMYATFPWHTGRTPRRLRSATTNSIQFGTQSTGRSTFVFVMYLLRLLSRGRTNYARLQYKFHPSVSE